MREIRPSGSEGGVTFQPPSLPLSASNEGGRVSNSCGPERAWGLARMGSYCGVLGFAVVTAQ